MIDPVLESLSTHVVAPLSDDVGEDLSRSSSIELIQIRNQFNDSSKDFGVLYENGRLILTEKSKDLWAAWALVGGLLWSKQFDPVQAFAVSCQVVHQLCEKYWDKLYPESVGLRSTLLLQMAKWWNTFIVRCSEGANAELLKVGYDELQALQQFLATATPGENDQAKARAMPVLNTLPQLIRALGPLAGVGKAAASESEQSSSNGAGASSSAKPAETDDDEDESDEKESAPRGPDALEKSFQKAADLVSGGKVEAGLNHFRATLNRYGGFADQFRGRVMLGELYLKARLPTHAKRVLQYAHEEIDSIRLPDWDPALCSRLWSNLMRAHLDTKEERPSEKLLSELFAQLCRIDPATAANLDPVKKGD